MDAFAEPLRVTDEEEAQRTPNGKGTNLEAGKQLIVRLMVHMRAPRSAEQVFHVLRQSNLTTNHQHKNLGAPQLSVACNRVLTGRAVIAALSLVFRS